MRAFRFNDAALLYTLHSTLGASKNREYILLVVQINYNILISK